MIMTGSFTPRAKAAETTTPLCGDANGDNWLDVRDVYAIRYSDYHQSFTYEQEKASDINGDGKCDVLDCDCILDYLVGGWCNVEPIWRRRGRTRCIWRL